MLKISQTALPPFQAIFVDDKSHFRSETDYYSLPRWILPLIVLKPGKVTHNSPSPYSQSIPLSPAPFAPVLVRTSRGDLDTSFLISIPLRAVPIRSSATLGMRDDRPY